MRVAHSDLHLRETRLAGPTCRSHRKFQNKKDSSKNGVHLVQEEDTGEGSEMEPDEREEEELDIQEEDETVQDEEDLEEVGSARWSDLADEEDISQAFLAGWKAKKQTADSRKARGYSNTGTGQNRGRTPNRAPKDKERSQSSVKSRGEEENYSLC